MTLKQRMNTLARKARQASQALYETTGAQRKRGLLKAASLLLASRTAIRAANRKDLMAAEKAGITGAMLDRLTLTDARIEAMARGLREVAAQPDPVGLVESETRRPNGMLLQKVRVPLGAVLFIYESRPNVTIDAAGLCLKAGDAVILRGGKEAVCSNAVLTRLFRQALRETGLPVDAVQLVDTTDREAITHLLVLPEYIDLVIPRGGEGLILAVAEQSRIPVLKHYKGLCHVYLDRDADPAMAEAIAVNAKVQRPGVCNAAETLLFDKALKPAVVKRVLTALSSRGVALIGDAATAALFPGAKRAREADYHNEYLALTLSVRAVDGVKGAAAHIRKFGSAHTDTIVTQNRRRAEEFLRTVDSSSVMWNVSTRLADGGEYGLGAEVGISTDKIHARGPMGAFDLTTYKWVVKGKGQLRK